jgi:phage terminase large subunit
LFGGGAGGGKSLLGCYWILKMCLKYPNTRWLIGRSKLHTLKATTYNTLLEVIKMQGLTSADYKYNGQTGFLTFKTGSQIVFKDLFYYPSDPYYDKLGSMEITGAFIDEASEVTQRAFQILSSRIRFQLDDNGLIPKILLTCNPTKNWLYTEFYKPDEDGTLETHRRFVKSLVTDNPYISKHYIGQLNRLDRISRERLLNGNWKYDDTQNKLFDYDAINDMFTNNFVTDGESYLSIDIARFGADSSVICYWNGWRCEEIKQFKKYSIVALADEVNKMAIQYKVRRGNIIADEDGVGGGLVDMVRGCKGFVNNSRALLGENYSNLKTQCYYKLAEKVNKGEIFCRADMKVKDYIVQELEVVEMKDMDKDNKLQIVSKDKIKQNIGRSPDFSDALMMRMYFELKVSNKITYYG